MLMLKKEYWKVLLGALIAIISLVSAPVAADTIAVVRSDSYLGLVDSTNLDGSWLVPRDVWYGTQISVAVLSDGRLVSARDDSCIQIVDPTDDLAQSGGAKDDKSPGYGDIADVAVLPGDIIAVVRFDNYLGLVDSTTKLDGSFMDQYGAYGPCISVDVLSDGRLAMGRSDGYLQIVDPTRPLDGYKDAQSGGYGDTLTDIAVLPGDIIAVVRSDGYIGLVDSTNLNGSFLSGALGYGPCISVDVLLDGRLAVARSDGYIQIVDPTNLDGSLDAYSAGYGDTITDIAVIPEPATLGLIGLGGLAMMIRRRNRK